MINLKEKKDKFYLLFYALKHKQFLPLSIFKPILLYLIFALICLALLACLSDTCLCDGESLEELKSKLVSYIQEYNEFIQEYKHYSDLLEQAKDRLEKDNGIERYLKIKKNAKAIDVICSLAKIRIIETSIKAKEPNFIPTIKEYGNTFF
jgi:hypothetical protein